ncbi:MAG: hypothetical protein QF654_00485 [Alphaproteobacteria bacterium]|jgi:hypothetical protein|nr:hypothetical protein [Alphaproteobacteria bacterium]|tara:strand:- start:12 stop:368 length:357 start_codon:yes stop_codon:yes gene_type:complete
MVSTSAKRCSGIFVEIGLTVFGLIMVFTPLALWMAPNVTAYYVVLGMCGLGYFAVVLLARYGTVDEGAGTGKDDLRVTLPAELIVDFQNQREAGRCDTGAAREFVANQICSDAPTDPR